MVAPAPAPKTKKTIDQCLADFHGCMTTSTLAPAPRAASAPATRAASAPAPRAVSAPAPRAVSAPAASQYTKGSQNRANIEKVLNTTRSNCTTANKKFATFIDSKGLIVVPTTAACPPGTSKIADGPDSRPIAGFVPCVPTGKTAKDLLRPIPDEIMKGLKACMQRGTSGYAMEGSPFGGVVSTGRNTKLILTLLVLAILLWILAKNM